MKRRGVRPDELELWRKVAETTKRLKPEQAAPKTLILKPAPVIEQKALIEPFQIGAGARKTPAHDVLPGLPERLASAPVKMDKKAHNRLKRGKLSPEARIDLHGMTMDQAHPVLIRFILQSHARGLRLVLVITGKGKDRDDGGPIPVRRGVLRHNVPGWLSVVPLGQVVLQVSSAHLKHGGGGAYYVYLRRQR
ncbi:Smr domain protein [hydrothermal vent metagenome]|uniref:Smr domain protein n=1 Tax=hydrothermal vent metagenome TaxID=652676 RepID=A0A3B0S6R6_9ZZZZ